MMGDADEEMKAEMKALRGHANVVDDLVLMRSSTIPSDYGNYGYQVSLAMGRMKQGPPHLYPFLICTPDPPY